MDKVTFLRLLNHYLKRVPKQERKNAIAFYEEYFADAADEAQAVAALPHPKQVAAKIIMEVGQRGETDLPILTIVLAIFSLPVTIPLVLLSAVLTVLFVIGLGVVVLAIVALFALCMLCAAALFAGCIAIFAYQTAKGLLLLLVAAVSGGVCVLGFLLVRFLVKKIFAGFRTLFLRLGKKRCDSAG